LDYDPLKRPSAYQALEMLPKDFEKPPYALRNNCLKTSKVVDMDFDVTLLSSNVEEEAALVQLRPSQKELCIKISTNMAKLIQFDASGIQPMVFSLFKLFEEQRLGLYLIEQHILKDLSLLHAVVANMICVYLYRSCIELKLSECSKIAGIDTVYYEILLEKAVYLALEWPAWAYSWTKPCRNEP
jgi:hypothetical protein